MKTGKRIFIIITMGLMMISFQTMAQTWKPLGNGVPYKIEASCVNGNDLYVAYFDQDFVPHDSTLIQVAKWDGTSWSYLPTLTSYDYYGSSIRALCVYKNELYLGGIFDSILGLGGKIGLIKYNGSSWQMLPNNRGVWITTMTVYNSKLYIAGNFQDINNIRCNNIACWDGTNWQALGNTGYEGIYSGIEKMIVFNNKLFFCGNLNRVGNNTGTFDFGYWDGTNLIGINSPLPKVIQMGTYNNLLLLCSYNEMNLWDGDTIWNKIATVPDFYTKYYSFNSNIEYNNQLWFCNDSIRLKGLPQIYNIVIWNGSSWLPYVGINYSYNSGKYISDFKILNGKLIIIGQFDTLNGVQCNNIAYFNSSVSNIGGNVYFDSNSNCIKDINEEGLPSYLLEIQPGSHYTCTNEMGKYEAYVDTGTITISAVRNNGVFKYWVPTACNPKNYNIHVGSSTQDTNNNFATIPIPNIEDSRIFLTGQTGFTARHGRTENYTVDYENIGTTTFSSGVVNLTLDSKVALLSASPTYTSYTHPDARWNFTNLQPGERRTINLTIKTDTSLNINDTIHFYASVQPITGDTDVTNNYSTLKQRIVTAIDPNDKQCFPDGNILPQTSKIDYIIRFQNTGNHVAYRVRVIDTVTEKLPLTKVLLKTSSHPYELTVKDNVITWTFNNIMLPDSSSDEPNSHGYISYTAFIKPGLALGTKITNKAYIYFDYQSPVITKATENIIALPVSIDEQTIIENKEYKVYPNPASGQLNIIYLGKNQKQELSLVNSFGQIISSLTLRPDEKREIDISKLPNGLYLIRDIKGRAVNKIIVNH